MTENIRNDSMTELLRADFFARNEPNAAWSHSISNHLMIPALRGFWPMSAHHVTAQAAYVDDIACGFDLGMINTPWLQQGGLGLPPICQFVAANSEYLTYGADDIQHDILGTETIVTTTQRGLSLGCWVHFTTMGALTGIIGKWWSATDNRAYLLYKNAADQIEFAVSNLGTAASTVIATSAATIAADTWYWVMGRFIPSVKLDVYVDLRRDSSVAAAPAAIFNSSRPLEVGTIDGACFLDGYLSLMWLAASTTWDGVATTRDVIPFALYEHSKRIFNK